MNVSSWRNAKSSDEWYTPPEIISALGPFDLDPACGPDCTTVTASRRFGPAEDGLKQPWTGRVWLNPPFSNAKDFVHRMTEHGNGIALVFTRSDAMWWQRAVRTAGAVFVFSGRLKFLRPGAPKGDCPLGCCLIPFGAENYEAVRSSGLRGVLMKVEA